MCLIFNEFSRKLKKINRISFVSERFSNIWTKKLKRLFLRMEVGFLYPKLGQVPNVEYEIDYISKNIDRKIVKFSVKPVSEHCGSFDMKK